MILNNSYTLGDDPNGMWGADDLDRDIGAGDKYTQEAAIYNPGLKNYSGSTYTVYVIDQTVLGAK